MFSKWNQNFKKAPIKFISYSQISSSNEKKILNLANKHLQKRDASGNIHVNMDDGTFFCI
jgi:hypothetical protein